MYSVPGEQSEPTTEIGRRLRRLRLAVGLTPKQLGDAAGVSQPTVWRIETGDTESPGVKTLELIAGALRVPVSELTGESSGSALAARDDRSRYFARIIPIGMRASAGAPVGGESGGFQFPVGSASDARDPLYWLEISGDCLKNTIDDGDAVLVAPVTDWQRLRPGKIVIVQHGSELLCKRVARMDGQVILVADDGTAFHADETTQIAGVVRKIIKNAP